MRVEIKMKFNLKTLVVAAAFMAAGAANAAPLTLDKGGSVTDQGWTVSNLVGFGSLEFSETLRGALSLANASVEAAGDVELTVNKDPDPNVGFTSIVAKAGVTSLSGSFDGTTVSIGSVKTTGGATQTLGVSDVSDGGFITITDLRVDLANMDVYANIIGGNNVGAINDLKLWKITTIEGATSFAAKEGVTTSINTLSGLKIYDDAFNIFVQATGLNELGAGSLAGVNDDPNGYGVIRSSISVTATAAVPEPSTYALMGVGLVGIGLMARRRRAAQ